MEATTVKLELNGEEEKGICSECTNEHSLVLNWKKELEERNQTSRYLPQVLPVQKCEHEEVSVETDAKCEDVSHSCENERETCTDEKHNSRHAESEAEAANVAVINGDGKSDLVNGNVKSSIDSGSTSITSEMSNDVNVTQMNNNTTTTTNNNNNNNNSSNSTIENNITIVNACVNTRTSPSTIVNSGTGSLTTGTVTPNGTISMEGSPTWRKVLFERQPFEDNYVDPTQFLRDLRMNENVTSYKYEDVMQNTVVITQHISIVVIFVFMFTMELRGKMDDYSLLYIDVFVISVLWVLEVYLSVSGKWVNRSSSDVVTNDSVTSHRRLSQRSLLWAIFADINPSVFSLVIILVLLTPILSTLTVSYSDDTIVALSVLMMLIHVITADYSYLNAYTHKYQPNISVNAATFAVILMASRIESPLKNGELIAFGTICFSISPIARHALKCYSFIGHVAVTCMLFFLATLCLLEITILAILFVVVCALISFVIPIFFVKLHSSVKTQINGPWDEAKPTNSAAAA